jgi:hypothetical protein
MTVPAAELREALQLPVQVPAWAGSLCSSVEEEIASGQLGDATQDWVLGAFGPTRSAHFGAAALTRAWRAPRQSPWFCSWSAI